MKFFTILSVISILTAVNANPVFHKRVEKNVKDPEEKYDPNYYIETYGGKKDAYYKQAEGWRNKVFGNKDWDKVKDNKGLNNVGKDDKVNKSWDNKEIIDDKTKNDDKGKNDVKTEQV
ncbi:2941_t:CDS:2 [Funneliformis caledonium]|uniref:2941_t:CDS:1 n=1 Tax=Funneliformis caledonium TaxID=1117310 RepID=A0A9N9DA21_9GLOM|nr:2941_t:CDS:2 [Funneliformis caledonium]